MATLSLVFDNADVVPAASVTALRASKRIKASGGAWDVSGFTPSNDFDKAETVVAATVTENRVYEFKVDALCSGGAISPNLNGIVEGIAFQCLTPNQSNLTHNSATYQLTLFNTDITKVRFILKKTSDDSVVQTTIVPKIGFFATISFLSLDPNESYYFTAEYYALVNGVEVISSDASYLGDPCGGSAEYEFTTNELPGSIAITSGIGNTISQVCINPVTYYIPDTISDIAPGVTIYADSDLTTPYTGYLYVQSASGEIYSLDNGTAVVGEIMAMGCLGDFIANNTMGVGNSIDAITPVVYSFPPGAFPIGGGESASGPHPSRNDTLDVDVTVTAVAELQYYINGALMATVAVPSSGTYEIPAHPYLSGDNVEIRLVSTI